MEPFAKATLRFALLPFFLYPVLDFLR